jgi:ATP synthase F1 delta subunit
MSTVILAQRYLNAFIRNVTPEKGQVALEQLIMMGETVLSQKNMVNVLSNPMVSREQKESLLMVVVKAIAVDVLILNLYKLILQKKRMDMVADIINQAKEMIPTISGQLDGILEVPCGGKTVDSPSIQKMIESVIKKEVRLSISEDESLIGGFKANVGFLVFDGTVESNLNKLIISFN